MTRITFEERVRNAMSGGATKEYFDSYLKSVLENARYADEKYHQSILFLLFFMVVFELLTRASIAEASIGPFKLTDASLLKKFIPVLVAYFYYSVVSLNVMRRYLGVAFDAVSKVVYKSVYDNDLDNFQLPASSFLLEEIIVRLSQSRASKYIDSLRTIVIVTLFIIPFLFILYAYYRCFFEFGTNSIGVWASVLLSLIFLLEAALILVQVGSSEIE